MGPQVESCPATRAASPLRRMAKATALAAAALGVSACMAKRPSEIEPASVDPTAYAELDCTRLVERRARIAQSLIFASLAQDHLADADKVRTLGVPTPMGSAFEDDREAEVARLKGELRAIDARLRAPRAYGRAATDGCRAD